MEFDVAGAEGPKRFFSRLTKTTISHAYLFTGGAGVGKKTFARRLAQSLLCEGSAASVVGYDGTCASCRLFGKPDTRHPDFFESSGALKIGDSEEAMAFHESEGMTSRDLVRQLSLQSYSGGLRVFLLGDADFASPAAANALLKFFEDPPAGIVMIVTTSAPARLLETIQSRMVEIHFAPLQRSDVATILRRLGYDARKAELGAALSQGSVTRALQALDQREDHLRDQVARWFFDAARGAAIDETWASRETLDEGLDVIKTLLRDWLALSAIDTPALAASDYAGDLHSMPSLDARTATHLFATVGEAQRLAGTNVTPALVARLVRMELSGVAR